MPSFDRDKKNQPEPKDPQAAEDAKNEQADRQKGEAVNPPTAPQDDLHTEGEERREQREDAFRTGETTRATMERSAAEGQLAQRADLEIESLHGRIRELEGMVGHLVRHSEQGAAGAEDDVIAGVASEFHRYRNRWRNLADAHAELTGTQDVGLSGVTLSHQVPKLPGELPYPAEPAAAHPEGRPPAAPLRTADPPPQGNIPQPGVRQSSAIGPQTGTGTGTGSAVAAEGGVMRNPIPAAPPAEQPLSVAQQRAERDVAAGKADRPAVREVGPGLNLTDPDADADLDLGDPEDAAEGSSFDTPSRPPRAPQGR